MKHQLRGWGLPACVCGYRRYDADKWQAMKAMDAHFRSPHDFSEHVAIIKQLTAQTAEQPNSNQDVALAILHLVECLEQLVNDPAIT